MLSSDNSDLQYCFTNNFLGKNELEYYFQQINNSKEIKQTHDFDLKILYNKNGEINIFDAFHTFEGKLKMLELNEKEINLINKKIIDEFRNQKLNEAFDKTIFNKLEVINIHKDILNSFNPKNFDNMQIEKILNKTDSINIETIHKKIIIKYLENNLSIK